MLAALFSETTCTVHATLIMCSNKVEPENSAIKINSSSSSIHITDGRISDAASESTKISSILQHSYVPLDNLKFFGACFSKQNDLLCAEWHIKTLLTNPLKLITDCCRVGQCTSSYCHLSFSALNRQTSR